MGSSTVRMDEESRMILQEIKGREGLSAQEVLHRALESYRRKLFLKKCGEAYQEFKRDREAWNGEEGERKNWDAVNSDGLEKDR